VDVPAPTAAPGQIVVRVKAASLNPLDIKLRTGALRPFLRLHFPAILGFDFAGEVVEVGPGTQGWATGDAVYGRTDAKTGGTHAELVAVSGSVIDRMPAHLSFVEAASLPLAAMTAIFALRKAHLRPGQRLLVNGAAGGVGSMAVQVGRALGAAVTGVCATDAVQMVAGLGASVLDYRKGEVARAAERFDVMLDTVSSNPRRLHHLLGARGTYITTGFSVGVAIHATFGRLYSTQRTGYLVTRADGELLRVLSGHVRAGQLVPIIDSTFQLDDVVAAHERAERGHARGKIVLTVP
jgi:NADPH:quinone reductase-like Zn-dependent oxidoreductase